MKGIVTDPSGIERRSMEIIGQELKERGFSFEPSEEAVLKRIIHASADFDYAENLVFLGDPVKAGISAFRARRSVVTDTNMAKAGISKAALQKLGGDSFCYMSDPEVLLEAGRRNTTRAEISMRKACREHPGGVFAVGNVPTALFALADLCEEGFRPSLLIGMPVGFVNVRESKERALEVCRKMQLPAILAMGRKGGSSVTAACVNALLYLAAGMADPEKRS